MTEGDRVRRGESGRAAVARLGALLLMMIGLQLACARADAPEPQVGQASGTAKTLLPAGAVVPPVPATPQEGIASAPFRSDTKATEVPEAALIEEATSTASDWPTAEEIGPGLSVVFFPSGPTGWNPTPTATWSFVDYPDYPFPTMAWRSPTPRPATATPPPTSSPTVSATATAIPATSIPSTESATPEGSTATATTSTEESGASQTPSPAPIATVGPIPMPTSIEGRIAFSADHDHDGKNEIYLAESPWTEAKRIAFADQDQLLSDWLAPGDEILFESREAGEDGPRLYRVGIDGSDLRPLLTSEMPNAQADGSPDGSEIALVGWDGGQSDLFLVNADGSGLRRLTQTEADEASPDWSPDGEQLAFVATSEGRQAVYRMNADGSDVERLTSSPARESEPAWSPTGGVVALVRADGAGSQIWLVSLDGTAAHPLVVGAQAVISLAWSSDGQLLAFVADWGEGTDVFVVEVASDQIFRLTASAEAEQGLAWVR